jgi:hypothetical protein
MPFQVGDAIYNKVTHEEGRVVRITGSASGGSASGVDYIVSVTPHPNWNMLATEVFWPESQVRSAGAEPVRS